MQKLPFCYDRSVVVPFVCVVTRLVLINYDSVCSIIITQNSALCNSVVGAVCDSLYRTPRPWCQTTRASGPRLSAAAAAAESGRHARQVGRCFPRGHRQAPLRPHYQARLRRRFSSIASSSSSFSFGTSSACARVRRDVTSR